MTPEQRRLRAQVAANARRARPMARAALFAHLELQVDPKGQLPPDERDRLVRSVARAHRSSGRTSFHA